MKESGRSGVRVPMNINGGLGRGVVLGVEKRGRSLMSFQRVLASH